MNILRNISAGISSALLLIALGMVNVTSAEATNLFELQFTATTAGGGILSGRIVYDTSVPDANPDPGVGIYPGAIRLFSTKILDATNNLAEVVTQTLKISGGTALVGLPGDGIGHCGPTVVCLFFTSPPGASSVSVDIVFPAGSLLTDALPTDAPRRADSLIVGLNDLDSQFSASDVRISVRPVSFVSTVEESGGEEP